MKTCEKCNCVYDDSFKQCPKCAGIPLFDKYNILMGGAALSLFGGIILIFINFKIALLAFAVFIAICIIVHKEYPEVMKRAAEAQNKTVAAISKKFSIIHIEGIKNTDQNQKCTLKVNSEYLSFEDNKENCIELIKLSNIKNLCILEEIEQAQKNKSTIGRAVVGGLLLGPVGAIVGGLSSLNPTMVENKKYYLEIKTSGNPDIIITSDNKTLRNIKDAILVK